MRLIICGESNPIDDWRRLYRDRGPVDIRLSDEARTAVIRSSELTMRLLRSGEPIYGVNTGFGRLASRRIPEPDIERLQRNLVLSHTVGVGPPLRDAVVRLVLALKVAALARGASGVRPVVVDTLIEMVNRGVLPVIPGQGSVGASGDLAPLAHLAAVLIGRGSAVFAGEVRPGAEALRMAGIEPLVLGPKEGLALVNGTQVSTALALAGLFETERVMATALAVGAMSVEAALGSTAPFGHAVQALRPHPGQLRIASVLRQLLCSGDFREASRAGVRVQDPYCLRCLPQVLGACLDLVEHARTTLAIEAGSVTDNPVLLADTEEIVSAGNFHGEPVAFAADMLAIALSEIGAMSERRTAFLLDQSLSGLPAFLTGDSGVTSGFMSLQITAAALASENKQRSHPASVDSIPTVGNQEDFVSMATHGARRLADMADNASAILAIELLAAVEGMDHRPGMRSSDPLEEARRLVRSQVPSMADDWEFSQAVTASNALVRHGAVANAAGIRAETHLTTASGADPR
ncbi:histidine ammonia-lyase [Rugosimonospora africana]|uniref:Histidine ammonia-lyase n=1 Tax=Rugosimonospora africana TaxID=556532 RepID=A0A8J3QTE4_9ACTN|nr:histidine ammonia-lyase [Rugosimonospora africana]